MNPESINQPDPEAKGERGPAMNGADVLVKALEREGVDVVFAYPGGASMELHQSLTRSETIRTILPRQEQGGGFMAHGYARATGKAGVCMATSGPGATNLVTCIADAYMDSIPLVAITGQVYQQFIGKSAFQETDFFGMTLPIVKHSYLVLTAEELPRIVKEAFYLAETGRPGPVVIDIPKDVQQAVFEPFFPAERSQTASSGLPFRIPRNSLPVTLAALLCSCGSSSEEGFRVEPVPLQPGLAHDEPAVASETIRVRCGAWIQPFLRSQLPRHDQLLASRRPKRFLPRRQALEIQRRLLHDRRLQRPCRKLSR